LVFSQKAGNRPDQYAPTRRAKTVGDPARSGPYDADQEKHQGENEMSFSRRTLLKATAASAVIGGVGAPYVARA
jgi:hypothetical protein